MRWVLSLRRDCFEPTTRLLGARMDVHSMDERDHEARG